MHESRRQEAGGKSARATVQCEHAVTVTTNQQHFHRDISANDSDILLILPLLRIVECHTSTGTEKQTNILFILHAAFGKWYGQEKGMWKWREGVLERIRVP